MRYGKVCVEALGYELPQKVVTSQSLEERLAPVYAKVNRSYGRLELMTGIRERRFWEPGILPSDKSIESGELAIAAGGIDRQEIGLPMPP